MKNPSDKTFEEKYYELLKQHEILREGTNAMYNKLYEAEHNLKRKLSKVSKEKLKIISNYDDLCNDYNILQNEYEQCLSDYEELADGFVDSVENRIDLSQNLNEEKRKNRISRQQLNKERNINKSMKRKIVKLKSSTSVSISDAINTRKR